MNHLDAIFERQRTAFRRHPNPSAAERRTHLDAIRRLLVDHADAIAAAIDADFARGC